MTKKGYLIVAIILAAISAYLVIGTVINLSHYSATEILLMILVILVFSLPSVFLFKKYNKSKSEPVAETHIIRHRNKHLSIGNTGNKSESSYKKGPTGMAIGGAVVAIFVICAIAGLYQVLSNPEAYNTNPVYNYSKEERTEINSILAQCGVNEDYTAEHDESLDNMNHDGEIGYRLSSDGINNIILYVLDGKVTMVRYADHNLYANGEVLDNVNNYAMTISEFAEYQTWTEKAVKEVLVSPSTADFCSSSEYAMSKDNGLVTVQGYVDSQNLLGAMIRGEFQAQFENGALVSLIVDGTEYVK